MLLQCMGLFGLLLQISTQELEPTFEWSEDLTLQVDNGGEWGEWGEPEFCTEGEYVIGYSMKFQEKQVLKDNTALNGVRLFCAGTRLGSNITSSVGHQGQWGPRAMCHQDHVDQLSYIKAFALQVDQNRESFDDTAANWIRFKCGLADETVGSEELTVDPGHGLSGEFGHWSSSCINGAAVCGIQTKVETDQSEGDDTSLNDVRLFCCEVFVTDMNHLIG